MHVVIIDDVDDHVNMIRAEIQAQHRNWQIKTFLSGEEALRDGTIAAGSPTVVVCDNQLNTVLQGLEILLILKERHPAIRSILITGEALYVGAGALRSGIDDFVIKDGDWPRVILEKIEILIEEPDRDALPRCFAVMPYDAPFDEYYEKIWKEAARKAGFEIYRNDEVVYGEPILDEIKKCIFEADVVIADLTGLNANVLYEVGVAHGHGVRTILLTQDSSELPTDIRHIHHIEYQEARIDWNRKLEEQILRALLQPSNGAARRGRRRA